MADVKPKTADWEPGTLEKTRRAIGNIDTAEAQKMTKLLGGEIMYERSLNNSSSLPQKKGKIIRSSEISSTTRGSSDKLNSEKSSASSSENEEKTTAPIKGRKNSGELPIISSSVNAKIDKIMMLPEYAIKPNYGFFNFIKYFQQNGHEQIVTDFVLVSMKLYIDNIQSFITIIKTFIQMAPSSYKSKIATGTEPKFKFLRMIANWTIQNIKLTHLDLTNLPAPYLLPDLIPYTKALFHQLLQVYYYGESKIPILIKEIYADEISYPDSPKAKLSELAKDAITKWLYIQNEIIRKMYPILMRMCSTTFEEYPAFFKEKSTEILKFVGLQKYELLLQDKSQKENKSVKEEKKQEQPKKYVQKKGEKDSFVTTGITLLDQLFPQAGFKNLDQHPDMYPYFHPLYKFPEGFNLLSPENPLHITLVLARIVEDCFQGCRNIMFSSESLDSQKSDTITSVLDDWSAYREIVFGRLYCEPLNDLVNQIYSQHEFEKSQFGKKLYTSLLWQTVYHFIPNFKFTQLILEHPQDESKFLPLFKRTDFVRTFLTEIVKQCDSQAATRGDVPLIRNPWEHYKFDIQNEVSKRLDVILGGNNTNANTNANNANLLKYTLCILSVLDWWINNPESPSLAMPPMHIFRVSDVDGKPQFSVPVRNDQNKLFANQIRSAYQKKAGE